MKKSQFTLELPDGDQTLLFNTLHGSLIRLEPEYYAKYDRILHRTEEEGDQECKDVLAEQKIIVEEELDELQEFFDLQRQMRENPEVFYLTVLPTTACNMKCVYCFEHLKAVQAYEGFEDDLMDFVERYCRRNQVKVLEMCWFGGEPLLSLKLIEALSERLLAFTQERGIEYNASIITNGILLTEEIAVRLKNECMIKHFQITLDGPEEVHNRNRVYDKGNGFQIILNNVKAILGKANIGIRVNLGKDNLNDLEELIKNFDGIEGFKEHTLVSVSKMFGDTPLCLSNQIYNKKNLETLRHLKNKGYHVVLEQYFPNAYPLPCASLTNHSVYIDPEGYLYRCAEISGVKEHSFSHMKTWSGDEPNRLYESFRYPEQCLSCAKLPICHNGKCVIERSSTVTNCLYMDEELKEIIDFYEFCTQEASDQEECCQTAADQASAAGE